jgi:taurine dioxygenase
MTAATAHGSESRDAAFTVRRLTPCIAGEVSGLDLSQALSEPTVQSLRKAWLEHLVLVFREQTLSDDDLVCFARCFGTPIGARSTEQTNPNVMLISNIRENGKLIGLLPDGELQFHADSVFLEKPLMGAILSSVELPSTGGNTLFASTYAAYDALSREEKRRLSGLTAVNAFDYATQVRTGRFDISKGPHWTHPVIRTHPETGRKGIFVNRLMTQHIVGMPQAESDALLSRLWELCERRELVYEHVWRVGDVVMWDNRCTQHARTDFPEGERRLLRRVGIEGDKPY